jgi:hypothetical protein
LKETLHFAVKFRYRGIVRLATGIEYDGPLRAQLFQMQAHCLSQAPLDTVPYNGLPDRARDRETDMWSGSFWFADTKGSEQGAGMAGTLVVNSSEVLRTQQTDTFRKTRDGGLPLVTDREFLPASRAAAGENSATVFGFHAGTKAVSLGTVTIIRLKGTFRHCSSIL